MPVLPATPPSIPSFLQSPLVGLASFVGVVVVISGGCFVGHRVTEILAARRARPTDTEKAGNASTAILEGKTTGAANNAALSVLIAARATLHAQQTTSAAKTQRLALHKALMTGSISKPVHAVDAPFVLALSSCARTFLRHQGEQHAPGRVVTRRTWSLPGPSPLRFSITAPAPDVEHVPAPLAVVSTDAAPVHILAPVPAVFVEKPPTRSELILARLGDDTDSDSSSDYASDDEDTDRGDDDIDELIRSVSIPIPISIPSQPHVLVDSRLRNLRHAAYVKRSVAKTFTPQLSPGKSLENGMGKRLSVRARKEKENFA
ncbi:hypothetical protein FB451DRAFT_1395311 [Mycena latifolia]|nr:hypothetical protein FB451DRAFT_1395311 [Mycena latifolia]